MVVWFLTVVQSLSNIYELVIHINSGLVGLYFKSGLPRGPLECWGGAKRSRMPKQGDKLVSMLCRRSNWHMHVG